MLILSKLSNIDKVIMLMKDNYNSIGFIPRSRIEEADQQGCLYYQVDNGEWVGYLYCSKPVYMRTCKIWQECIDKSVRRYGSGRRLCERLINDCRTVGCPAIMLRCAEDLESNYFWQAMGFSLVGIDTSLNVRKRKVFRYRLDLEPTFFDLLERRHKQ